MEKQIVSLSKEAVIDAKAAINEVEVVETGVYTNIGVTASYEVEFTENGRYAITIYGEPVDEPAFATVEGRIDGELVGVFTLVGEEAKKGIGGTSRAFDVEKGTHVLSIKPTGGRGGCILERVVVGKALVENPNSYKPSDRETPVEYKDNWGQNDHSVYKTIYVAPDGCDSASGQQDAPFQTLKRAKEEVAASREAMTGDIVVEIAPGYYELTEVEVFGPEHGGNETYNVIYRGADAKDKPLISGGKKITGWEKYNEYLWRAPAPEGTRFVRNLYVNGISCTRARSKYTYPCEEIYIDETKPRMLEVDYGTRHITYERKDGAIVSAKNFPTNLTNIEDIELVWSLIWTRQRFLVKDMKTLEDGRILFMMDPDSFNVYHDVQGIRPNKGYEFYIENAFELLDEPGEFYFNRKEGYIYYFPYAQEDMETAETFIGNIEGMMNVGGTKEAPARGLVFDNLDIRYGAWNYVSENGLFTSQADAMVLQENGKSKSGILPSQFNFNHADRVAVTNCCISCLGSSALNFGNDAHNIKIVGILISDCSGAGIKVGSPQLPYKPDEFTLCTNILIENNAILRIGGEYAGCTGIVVYYAGGVQILHNTMNNTSYTGISLGWGWGTTDPAGNGGMVVKYNNVTDAMMSLGDGSHIYTLGPLRNSEIAYNYFGKTRDDAGGTGVYFDAGTGFVNAHDNVTRGRYKCFTASGHHWIHNCRLAHYWANCDGYEVPGDLKSMDYEPPMLVPNGEPWPIEAQKIIDESGVTKEYAHLMEMGGTPTWRTDRLNAVPKKSFYTRRVGDWINAGEFVTKEDLGWHKHKPQYWQNCCRMCEGVCFEYLEAKKTYIVSEAEPGEWLKYRIQIAKDGLYSMDMCVSDDSKDEIDAKVNIYFDDVLRFKEVAIPRTETLADLVQIKIGEIKLAKGMHFMKLEFVDRGFSYSSFRFHDGSLYEEDKKGIFYDEGVVVK